MKLHSVRTLAIATTVGLGLGVAGLGTVPAGASTTGPAVAYTKARCNRAIDERLFILKISENRIAQVKRLTPDQRTAQIAGIDSVESHLVDVNRPAVNTATTGAAVRTACQAIYNDNRVYVVVMPQLFASVRIDEFANAFDRFDPLIAEKSAAGADTSAVAAFEASAKAHVDSAAALVSSVSPDSYNADPAGTRATLDQTTAELHAALADLLRGIVAFSHLVVPVA